MRTNLTNIQWCPGCGDFMILMAIKKAFEELGIKSKDRVVVTGVGCSGKLSQYIDGYAAETLHGRALPFATGVKTANPKLTVVVVGGDGDGYGIGIGHFLHSCRRDIDITYIVCNNENYGLTTGQASPTTPIGAKTKTTPNGCSVLPFDPVKLAQDAGCSFSRKGDASNFRGLIELIKEGINNKGFSHLDVAQACPSFKRW